jgi:hypothetical protein
MLTMILCSIFFLAPPLSALPLFPRSVMAFIFNHILFLYDMLYHEFFNCFLIIIVLDDLFFPVFLAGLYDLTQIFSAAQIFLPVSI